MTGPEHYREAEQALDRASREDFGTAAERYQVARAQVHATLALAAAAALGQNRRVSDGRVSQGMPEDDSEAWHKAAGVRPA